MGKINNLRIAVTIVVTVFLFTAISSCNDDSSKNTSTSDSTKTTATDTSKMSADTSNKMMADTSHKMMGGAKGNDTSHKGDQTPPPR